VDFGASCRIFDEAESDLDWFEFDRTTSPERSEATDER